MAFSFGNSKYVNEGYLDNTTPGKTVGEVELAGLGKVVLELEGDMQGQLGGRRLNFRNPSYDPEHVFVHGAGKTSNAQEYMRDFKRRQVGDVGNIFLDAYLQVEWYSDSEWQCLIELPKNSCHVQD